MKKNHMGWLAYRRRAPLRAPSILLSLVWYALPKERVHDNHTEGFNCIHDQQFAVTKKAWGVSAPRLVGCTSYLNGIIRHTPFGNP